LRKREAILAAGANDLMGECRSRHSSHFVREFPL
jgi:hypothetical protein